MFDDRLSKKSKRLPPPIFTPDNGPNESEQTAPTTQQITKSTTQAHTRLNPFSSTRYATATSSMEMDDVSAATRSARKNSIATKPPAGIWPKTNGRVSKTRPGPDCGLRPKAKTAGIMAMPAMRANIRSETAVAVLWKRMFSFLSTYDAYVIMVPNPRDREKNACPRAAAQAFPVILEKSGLKR